MDSVRALRLLAVILLSGLSGCSLSRDTPQLRQYVLGAAMSASSAVSAAEASEVPGLVVGVRRLQLADYLAQPGIVTRRGANEVIVSEFHRWGEDLDEGITRVAARRLAATSQVAVADVAPWPTRTPHDYLLQIRVSRFEGAAATSGMAGAAQMVADWDIIEPRGGAVLARGHTSYHETGWTVGDYDGLVMLLDRGLVEMAGEIASCVADVAAAGTTTAAQPLACRAARVRAAQ